jgi:hypothetical protein
MRTGHVRVEEKGEDVNAYSKMLTVYLGHIFL